MGSVGIDVADMLRRERQDVTGVEIKVAGTQDPAPPWTWKKAHLDYVVRGRGLESRRVERAMHLSETKYCSVGAAMDARWEITSAFEIVEEEA